jgi:NhaP-type Na+/H+ or K+/H+ antiporter
LKRKDKPKKSLQLLILTKTPTEALSGWLIRVLLWEVGPAIPMGALIGYIAGRFLVWAEAKHSIEKPSFLAYTLAISLFVLGFVKLLGSDRILAVFVAGIAFDMVVGGSDRAEEENVQEAIGHFLPFIFLYYWV